MQKFILSVILTVGFSLQAQAIIGGSDAIGDEAFVHSTVGVLNVTSEKFSGCTATLLSSEYALTAAHCVYKTSDQFALAFGLNKTQMSKANIRPVTEIFIHPHFQDRPLIENDIADIAIVRFSGNVFPGYYPVRLAREELKIENLAMVLIAGFGSSGFDGAHAGYGGGVLRFKESFISDSKLSSTEFAIGNYGGPASACYGDSGGPAFALALDGDGLVQIGLLMGHFDKQDEANNRRSKTFSNRPSRLIQDRGCYGKNKYTAISAYRSWIDHIVHGNRED